MSAVRGELAHLAGKMLWADDVFTTPLTPFAEIHYMQAYHLIKQATHILELADMYNAREISGNF